MAFVMSFFLLSTTFTMNLNHLPFRSITTTESSKSGSTILLLWRLMSLIKMYCVITLPLQTKYYTRAHYMPQQQQQQKKRKAIRKLLNLRDHLGLSEFLNCVCFRHRPWDTLYRPGFIVIKINRVSHYFKTVKYMWHFLVSWNLKVITSV